MARVWQSVVEAVYPKTGRSFPQTLGDRMLYVGVSKNQAPQYTQQVHKVVETAMILTVQSTRTWSM